MIKKDPVSYAINMHDRARERLAVLDRLLSVAAAMRHAERDRLAAAALGRFEDRLYRRYELTYEVFRRASQIVSTAASVALNR